MDLFPFEKDTIYIYKFFFEGKDEPLIIECRNKIDALEYIMGEFQKRPHLLIPKIRDERVTTPVTGITEKDVNGDKYVWAGLENSPTGWVTESEFKILNIET